MSTITNAVAWTPLLKELYPGDLPREILQRRHVFLSKVPKDGDAYGKYIVVPVVYAGPSGRSADITQVLSTSANGGAIGPTQAIDFQVKLASDYAGTWIDELTMKQAMNDRGAFVAARKTEVDGLLRELGNSLSHALYRDGTGSLGRLDGSSAFNGTTLQLLTKSDTKFFNIGMQLDFVSNVSGVPTAVRALAGSVRAQVTGINEDLGQVFCAKDSSGAGLANIQALYTSSTNTDFLCQVGDFTVATGGGKLRGLQAWIPLVAPIPGGGDNFWGVDRSAWPTRLCGHRLNDPTAPALDSIMSLAEVMHERGAHPDIVLVSPRQFSKISKSLNAKVEYDGAGGDAKYGFMTFGVATSAGILPVYADPDCPEDRGYILSLESWSLKYLELPEIVTTDGMSALRRPGLDQIEIRCRYYAQLVCWRPGDNGVFAVS